jgi:hypothetical protein
VTVAFDGRRRRGLKVMPCPAGGTGEDAPSHNNGRVLALGPGRTLTRERAEAYATPRMQQTCQGSQGLRNQFCARQPLVGSPPPHPTHRFLSLDTKVVTEARCDVEQQ